jgi:hypothetical protein
MEYGWMGACTTGPAGIVELSFLEEKKDPSLALMPVGA